MAWLLAVLFVTGCELGTVTIPNTTPTLVVHAVINPVANYQLVLLERTLTGNANIPDTTFNPSDPITTGGGIAVSGAIVEIIDSAGHAFRGIENYLDNGKGTGAYRVPLEGAAVVMGARYQLRVRVGNEELTAFTRVPRVTSRTPGGLTRTFNRDHDVVVAQWPRIPAARAYAVRIESPFGPFFMFTDSLSFRITGELRNLFASDLQRVFIPGFRQDATIAAVDSNFYDYYRTNNDPFTGAGIISRVNGGLGLFGSIVSLNTGTLSVVADQKKPLDGRFRLAPPMNQSDVLTSMRLYVESAPARPDLPAALSGQYFYGTSTRGEGLLGKMLGNEIKLAFIANQLAGDTVDVFTGELMGDTLRGVYRRSGRTVTFVRAP